MTDSAVGQRRELSLVTESGAGQWAARWRRPARRIDIDPESIREANAKKAGVTGRATFKRGDLFEADISEAP